MPEARVIWDEVAFRAWLHETSASPQRALYTLAVRVTVGMKARCPVSKVSPVYATGGATVPGGQRNAGDFPLRPSGTLRKSVVRVKQPDGSWLIGSPRPEAVWTNDGTPPHVIRSTGSWPLRSRVTGQIFGRIVHHPGTRGTHWIERSLEEISGVSVHA